MEVSKYYLDAFVHYAGRVTEGRGDQSCFLIFPKRVELGDVKYLATK